MNIGNIIIKETNKVTNKINKSKRVLKEDRNIISGKTIICVDIQPEYEDGIYFNLNEWAKYINKLSKTNKIIFLYNGADTIGMIDESSYMNWLIYDLGMKVNVVDNATFYDKGYAFFRYCIDNSINEDDIVTIIKLMIKYNITDSRDIDNDLWNLFIKETKLDITEVRELLEDSDDLISIPDLMDFLEPYENIVLMGGGINECLKEVEIALLSLDKKYYIYSEFVY
jgi:hypothetical protein